MPTTGPSAAGTTGSAAERESRQQERSGGSQIVVVDLEEAQSPRMVRRLRKGTGKLMTRVERIVGDLVQAGTIKSTAQPVVIVVREVPASFWPFEEDDD
jgi:hypothetical protein